MSTAARYFADRCRAAVVARGRSRCAPSERLCRRINVLYVRTASVCHARATNRCRGADVERSVLRPVRLRHRRSIPYPTYRRLRDECAALPQRAARLLGREPLRRRRRRAEGHGAAQLGEGRHPRGRHGRSGDAAGDLHQRGPAAAHHAPCARVPRVHAEEDAGDRGQDPRLLRRVPRSAGRRDRFDFVRDLGAELPMRTIGMLVGIPDAEQPAVREHANAMLRNEPGKPMAVDEGPLLHRRDVRRVRRMAREEPVGRPDHRAAQRRVRGRDGNHAQADQAGAPRSSSP